LLFGVLHVGAKPRQSAQCVSQILRQSDLQISKRSDPSASGERC
jgi:hypothetical protein